VDALRADVLGAWLVLAILYQCSEIVIMAGLGWMLRRLGPRNVITIGALAYFVRYLIWSNTGLSVELTVASLTIHGICYACFFASAFIYVDRLAPPDVRHSVQTVFGILILGGGPVLGGWLSGFLSERYTTGGALDYSALCRQLDAEVGLLVSAAMATRQPKNNVCSTWAATRSHPVNGPPPGWG
jgi:hypothetical protein